jgi:O-antigen ligase
LFQAIKLNRITLQQINFSLGLLLVFCIPIYLWSVTIITGLWLITWLIESNIKEKYNQILESKYLLLFPVYYLILVVGLLYSNNIRHGITLLEHKLTLFILPFIIFSLNDLYKKRLKKVFLSFVIGNFIASIICLVYALYRSLSVVKGVVVFNPMVLNQTDSFINSIVYGGNYFFYDKLSIILHPTYFSMYITFSIVIILFFLESKEISKRIRFLLIFLVLYFIIFLFLLSSRASYLTFLIISVIYFIKKIVELKKKILLFAFILFLTTITTIFFLNPRFSLFYKSMSDKNFRHQDYGDYQRISIWKSSFNVIKRNYLWGVGTGDTEDELVKEYRLLNLNNSADNKYDSHNQYLESFLGNGIFGLVLIVLILIVPFYRSLKENNFLLMMFIIIIGINFLFETILNTLAGIFFVAFFYHFILFQSSKDTSVNTQILNLE